MKPVFEGRTLLKGARNWCDVHERPLLAGAAAAAAALAGGVAGGPADGSLVFQLRVEHPTYGEVRTARRGRTGWGLLIPQERFLYQQLH